MQTETFKQCVEVNVAESDFKSHPIRGRNQF